MRRFLALILITGYIFPYIVFAITSNTHATTLNGTTQYWSISDASQSGLDITSDLTICGWINFSSYSSGTGYMWVGKSNFNDVGSARAYTIEQNITGANKFDVELGGAGGNVRKGVAWTPSTATWYFQCFVYTAAAGSVDFYINGATQGTQQTGYPTAIPNSSRPFQIGAQFDNTTLSYQFPGNIDDVLIWSRALSSSEIAAFYSDPCNTSVGSNLVSRWLFDNDGNDSVGANNLTNNKSATFTTSAAYTCTAAATPVTNSPSIIIIDDQ